MEQMGGGRWAGWWTKRKVASERISKWWFSCCNVSGDVAVGAGLPFFHLVIIYCPSELSHQNLHRPLLCPPRLACLLLAPMRAVRWRMSIDIAKTHSASWGKLLRKVSVYLSGDHSCPCCLSDVAAVFMIVLNVTFFKILFVIEGHGRGWAGPVGGRRQMILSFFCF